MAGNREVERRDVRMLKSSEEDWMCGRKKWMEMGLSREDTIS